MKLKWLIVFLLIAMFFIIILNLPKITDRLLGKGERRPANSAATSTKDNKVYPTVLTTEEKRKIGIDENLPAQAIRRDSLGNVLIYKVDKTNLPKDSDGDGLSDDKEKAIGTNPNNKDTDQDDIPDGQEVLMHFNPLDPKSPPPKK